jgi:hypothetical protein
MSSVHIVLLCTVTFGAGAEAKDYAPGTTLAVDGDTAEQLRLDGAARLAAEQPRQVEGQGASQPSVGEVLDQAEADATSAREAQALADALARAKDQGASSSTASSN